MNCKKCGKKLSLQMIRVDGKVINTKLLPCDCENPKRSVKVNVYDFVGLDRDDLARELNDLFYMKIS